MKNRIMSNNPSAKTLAENRRARFDYEILETYEAGLELSGPEVKAAKQGRMDLSGSYALVRNGQAWLINSKIPPYQPKNMPENYAPDRQRRLLLHRTEIASLLGKIQRAGLALLPLRAYLKRGFVKIELGLGRSRKKRDKRDLLKRRAAEREMKI